MATMCRVLEVSTSGYYAWLGCWPSKRAREDVELGERIAMIHAQSRGTYGAPRIHAELKANGIRVGRKRVARLMREAGLAGVSRRRTTKTTQRDPEGKERQDGDPQPEGPNPDLVPTPNAVEEPHRLPGPSTSGEAYEPITIPRRPAPRAKATRRTTVVNRFIRLQDAQDRLPRQTSS